MNPPKKTLEVERKFYKGRVALKLPFNQINDRRQARRVIAQAFAEEEDYFRTYIDNVAMLLYDRYNADEVDWNSKATRDACAEEILHLLFDI